MLRFRRLHSLLVNIQEFLLKRTAGLSAIARAGPGKVLADPDARGYALAVLDELNFSTPVAFKHKEKGAAAAAMSLLAPSALQVRTAQHRQQHFTAEMAHARARAHMHAVFASLTNVSLRNATGFD